MPSRTSRRVNRPSKPLDAFPNRDWTRWRDHVDNLDIEVIYAAALAERLGAILRAERKSNVSLRDIAKAAGISHSSISAAATCVTYPMAGLIARLENTLGVSLWPSFDVYYAKGKTTPVAPIEVADP